VIRDAWLVMVKDLRLERRSKVGIAQVLPFAILVLMLFAFALDPDRGVLERATPGLFWVAVLFSAVLTLQRSFGVEAEDGVLDALRLSGMAPAGIFFGKVAALTLQLLALEAVLALGVAVFYGTVFHSVVLLVTVALLTTLGIAASGAVYGALAARLRSRDTLLPLLMLPLLAPVLISATRAFEIGLERQAAGGWSWVALLGVFALAYLSLGAFLFRPLLEDA
jgi:heme exporter protein B